MNDEELDALIQEGLTKTTASKTTFITRHTINTAPKDILAVNFPERNIAY